MSSLVSAQLYQVSLNVHILFGFVGLIVFWLSGFSKKGSRIHVVAGRTFVISIVAICLSSFLMSFVSLSIPTLIHPDKSFEMVREFSAFLVFLGGVSLVTAGNGFYFAKHKARTLEVVRNKLLFLNISLLLGTVVMVMLGVLWKSYLVGFISLLGPNISGKITLGLFRKSVSPTDWQRLHLIFMFGGGIAIHTAFLAGGGTRFMPGFVQDLGWVAWLIPAIVAMPIQNWALKRLK